MNGDVAQRFEVPVLIRRTSSTPESGLGTGNGFLLAGAFHGLLEAMAHSLAVKVSQDLLAVHALGLASYRFLPFAGFAHSIKGFGLRLHKQVQAD
jgi:hypothetical protein